MNTILLPDKSLTGLSVYQREMVFNGHIPGYLSHFKLRRHERFYRKHPFCFLYHQHKQQSRTHLIERLKEYGVHARQVKFGHYFHRVWVDDSGRRIKLTVDARW